MATSRLNAFGAGLNDLVDARLNQLAARLYDSSRDPLPGKTAVNKQGPALPPTDTAPVVAEPLQIDLDALPYRRGPFYRPARFTAEGFHGLESYTPVDR